ncbi:MAG: hypothetical protein EXR66_08465 [Dehalococcoidia bacterium]|nr:hypothetical protein [Dehalococcoidia bacterium]
MNVFEPLFLLLLLAALETLVTIGVRIVRGQRERAWKLGIRLGAGVAVYVFVLVAASLMVAPPVAEPDDPQCFDDWCIAVAAVRWTERPGERLEVVLRLSSRARLVPMGERGTYVYILDGARRRYAPTTPPDEPPLGTILQPARPWTPSAASMFHWARNTSRSSTRVTASRLNG